MRKVSTALVLLAAGGAAVGCELFVTFEGDAQISGASGSSGTSSTSSSGMGGGDSGPPDECVPSKAGSLNTMLADTCGVFVRPTGDDTATGTKEKPLQTIGAAVKKGAAAIYVCEGTYTENVTITQDVVIYGGVDCDKGWAYDAMKRPLLLSPADTVALTITGAATNVGVEDFTIEASAALAPGGSSIAVLVDSASVNFARVAITANDGKAGANGDAPVDPGYPTMATDPALVGNNGTDACVSMSSQLGGGAKENAMCPIAMGGPIGGKGGPADTLGGSGGDLVVENSQTAKGGTGQPNSGAWSCGGAEPNGTGDFGANGEDGNPGAGGAAIGAISANGFTGDPGKDGLAGKPGQGGGGGGGAKGKANCAGATGGSGGAGGCGGPGGKGGQSGGSSIAILSVSGKLTFNEVTINLGAAGAGGDGSDGLSGGVGGFGGLGGFGNNMGQNLADACKGGDGGKGGIGGKGGGGRGGHAIGIAYKGMTIDITNVTFANKGTAGMGGLGDTANGNPGNGALGEQQDTLSFP